MLPASGATALLPMAPKASTIADDAGLLWRCREAALGDRLITAFFDREHLEEVVMTGLQRFGRDRELRALLSGHVDVEVGVDLVLDDDLVASDFDRIAEL